METTPARRPTGGPTRNACGKYRRIVFVLNNWTQEEFDHLAGLPCSWMIMARETAPTTGTPHLQGAMILSKQMSHSALKTFLGSRVNFRRMDGEPQDSDVYCSKQDPNPFVKGTLPRQGKRNDIHNAVERVRAGATLRDLAADADVGSAIAVVKFSKGLTVLRSALAPRRDSPPLVFWCYGPTGTGKTRACFSNGSDMFGTDGVWLSSGTLQWFDGYDGQPVAIFDDFRPKDISFNFLLRILDRYPVQVPFKGGFANWNPKVIFITAPKSPSSLFAVRKEHCPEDIRQLERRITACYDFDDDVTWSSWLAIASDMHERMLDGLPKPSSGSDLDPDPDDEPIPEL